MRSGAPRALRFTRRPSSRALSSSPRPNTAPTLPPPASIICAGICRCFLFNATKGENIMSTATLKEQSTFKDQTQRDEADIRALIESVHEAHHNKDAAALVAPYAQGPSRIRSRAAAFP